MEGTYPLPEAQVDRFLFKLRVLFPALDDLVKIMDRTTGPELPAVERVTSGATILAMQTLAREVAVAAHVKDYVARVVRATHPEGEGTASMAKRFVRYGASPRGAQALLLAAKVRALLAERANVSFEGELRNFSDWMMSRSLMTSRLLLGISTPRDDLPGIRWIRRYATASS